MILPVAAASKVVSAPSATSLLTTRFEAALLAAASAPTDPAAIATFRTARLDLARAVLEGTERDPLAASILGNLEAVVTSPLHDLPHDSEEAALLERCQGSGASSLVAGMLLAPAWRWTHAPEFDAVPNALLGTYARWSFAPPHAFVKVGDADRYADAILPRLESLAKWVERNGGSAAVRAAVTAYLEVGNLTPLIAGSGNLRRHAEARGRILKRILSTDARNAIPPEAFALFGRPLRLGFVAHSFGASFETFATLPLFENLDPQRFELALFPLEDANDEFATHCRLRASEYNPLGTDLSGQLSTLQLAGLDVLVFAGDLSTANDQLAVLASHRVAPLQVATPLCPATTGLPEIDLFISGDRTERTDDPGADYSERLALLPGTGTAYTFGAELNEPSEPHWSRDALDIPTDAVVFTSAAATPCLTAEVREQWARLLAATPDSHLIVFRPMAEELSNDQLESRFLDALAAVGVTAERLHIVTDTPDSLTDLAGLLQLADLYLDTYPVADDHAALVALHARLPVLTREGPTRRSRRTAGLLRALDLDDCVFQNADEALTRAAALAADESARAALVTRLRTAMNGTPAFLDSLAASDAFAALVMHAYETLSEAGPQGFRANREILTAGLDEDNDTALATAASLLEAGLPDDAIAQASRVLGVLPQSETARLIMARASAALQRHDRAALYLLGVVQSGEAGAAIWRELATAFAQSGNPADAITALETAIRLNTTDLDSWLMLGELARDANHTELLGQIVEVLNQVAAHDPRVTDFLTTLPPSDPDGRFEIAG